MRKCKRGCFLVFGRKGPPPEDDENDYNPDADGPMAKMSREELDALKRRHDADMNIINRFIDSLRPADSKRYLFTWAQQNEFRLRRKRDM